VLSPTSVEMRNGLEAHFLYLKVVHFGREENLDEQTLVELLEPVINGLGFELWSLEVTGRGRGVTLRICIDNENGINVDDCAQVSRQVSSVLDVEDPMPEKYTLEVSSPGLDRRLHKAAHYEMFKGHQVRVQLKRAYEGKKRYTGLLCGVEDEDVVIRVEDEEFLFPLAEIDKATLVVEL